MDIPGTIAMYWHHKKRSPSGWLSGNSICCIHNGHTKDTRGRGGLKITNDNITYHCFNCKFSTSWTSGKLLSKKMKTFMGWLNIPDDLIAKCDIEARRLYMDSEGGTIETKKPFIPEFPYRQLPPNSKPLSYWIEQGEPKIVDILNYMNSRALYFDDYDWHWSNDPKFKERLIIPFTYKNKIVGYTARAIGQSNQRYFSEQSTGYVFNTDNQPYDRKFAILCEGPLDAISIGGIASLGSNVSPSQNCVIAQLQKEIILVPDKDDAGMKLIECALEYGWSVSFPDWDDDIKDINDAVVRYGRLCTLYKIIQAKITNQLKIQILSKEWRRNGS